MNAIEKHAVLAFNLIVKRLVRFNPMTWAALAVTTFVVLGAALDSETFFLLGILGFVGRPIMLAVVAMILLPFEGWGK